MPAVAALEASAVRVAVPVPVRMAVEHEDVPVRAGFRLRGSQSEPSHDLLVPSECCVAGPA